MALAGVAYVNFQGDFSGLASDARRAGSQAGSALSGEFGRNADLKKRFNGFKFLKADADRAGVEAGSSLRSRFAAAFKGVEADGKKSSSVLSDNFKSNLKRGGAVAAAAGGFAVFKQGLDRLLSLEDASKRLEAMGVSAGDTDKLMGSLNKTLKGTPYSLDAGATAMAGFVSSGQDISQIPKVMGLVTDAAAFGGAALSEVADIFQDVTLNGKASATEINELQTRGVPAASLLSSALGLTGTQFRTFVSEGKLDSATFFSAWEKGAEGFGANNLQMVGSAKDAGEGVRGSFGNMLTALARGGAKILGPLFDRLPGLFNAVSAGADAMGGAFGRFANGPIANFVKSNPAPVFAALGAAILTVLVPAFLGWAASAGLAAISMILLNLPLITLVAAVALVAGALVYAYKHFETFRNVVDRVASGLRDGLGAALGWITGTAIPAVVGAVQSMIAGFQGVSGSGSFFTALGNAIRGVAYWAGDVLVPAFARLVGFIGDVLVPAFARLVGFIGSNLKPILIGLGVVIGGLVLTLGSPVVAVATLVAAFVYAYQKFGWFRDGVGIVFTVVSTVIRTAVGVIVGLFENVVGPAIGVLVGLFKAFAGVASVVWSSVSAAVRLAWSVVSPVFGFLGQVVGTVLVGTFKVFAAVASTVWAGVSGAIRLAWSVVEPVFGFLGRVVGTVLVATFRAFAGVASVVWSAVSAVIGVAWGIVRGIFAAIQTVVNTVLIPVFNGLKAVASFVFSVLSAVVRDAWEAIRPVFQVLGTAISVTLTFVFNAFKVVAGVVWRAISSAVTAAWGVISPVFKVLGDAIAVSLTAVFNAFKAVAGVVWTAISSAVTAAWGVVKPVFKAIGDVVGGPLSDVWNGMKDAAAAAFNALPNIISAALRTAGNVVATFMRGAATIAGAIGLNNIAGALRDGAASADRWGEGGGSTPTTWEAGRAKGRAPSFATGGSLPPFTTNGPRAIVGEGNPRWPEHVIPTDPKYRGRALALWEKAGTQLLASGGTVETAAERRQRGIDYVRAHQGWAGAGLVDKAKALGSSLLDKLRSIAAGGLEKIWPKLNEPGNLLGMVPGGLNKLRSETIGLIRGEAAKKEAAETAKQAAAAAGGSGGGLAPSTTGLNPEFLRRFNAYSADRGGKFSIGSGFRSRAQQQYLYDRWIARVPGQAKAAKPGSSNHERGLAIDHVPSTHNAADAAAATRLGLRYPMSYEPWHIEPAGGGSSSATGPVGASGPVASGSNRAIGQNLAAYYGWTGSEWNALDKLWQGESGWSNTAQNRSSTAYGIAQFLNSTWAGVGATKTSSPSGQIDAGLRYIRSSYGSPSVAYSKWLARSPHWYKQGGVIGHPSNGAVPGFHRGGVLYEDQRGWNWRTMGSRTAGAGIRGAFPNGLMGDLNQNGYVSSGEWRDWNRFADLYRTSSGAKMLRFLGGGRGREAGGVLPVSHHQQSFDSGGVLRPGWNVVRNDTGAPEPVAPVGRGGPVIGEAHFHDGVDLDLVLQKVDRRIRAGRL